MTLLISMGLAAVAAAGTTTEAGADPASLPAGVSHAVDYAGEIAPILEQHCVECHGADKQKAGLRLDTAGGLRLGGDGGAVIAAGEPTESVLFRVVSGLDPDRVMPPKGEGLNDAELALLRGWIEQGAALPETSAEQERLESDHWSFRPIASPVPPKVPGDWTRNAIDQFIQARLDAEGVKPAPEADKLTLLRRLHLDLTGLPPTLDEIERFNEDESEFAYERAVSRLLASPHFGERWGRYWLDIARYADSDGYEKDTGRPWAWRYRHWVIEALNRDLPYDQFIVEQIAGDLLPDPDQEQLVATGFHRNTLTNKEGGVDQEEFRVKQVVDRTNTTGAAILGLTMACAECHTHKYDPITQREYFQMYSFFNTSIEKNIPAPLTEETEYYKRAKAESDQRITEARKAIEHYLPSIESKVESWAKAQDVPEKRWDVLNPVSYVSAGGAEFDELDDRSLLLRKANPDADEYIVVARSREQGIESLRLECLTHERLEMNGPGRAENGNFVLGELRVFAAPLDRPHEAKPVKLKAHSATFEQGDYPLAQAVDGDPQTGWAIYRGDDTNADITATFTIDEPLDYPNGVLLRFEFDHRYGRQHNVGRFRLSVASLAPEALPYPDDVHAALLTPTEEWTQEQRALLAEYYKREDPMLAELQGKLDALREAAPQPPDTMAQVLVQNPDPPVTRVHLRGDFMSPGAEVSPGVPSVLPPVEAREGGEPDRLDFARWMVSPENPLTARVTADRVWRKLFGYGRVRTPHDFGVRGEEPTHPELLDWLATKFMNDMGWSTKELIRAIVTSSTYRQSSDVRPELVDRDPKNLLVARQNRFRVEAEIIRDLFLAASGLLHDPIGGPSIRPPLPEGFADLGYANSVKYPESPAPDKYRRGMYIWFQRTIAYPMLMTFDCPDSNVTNLNRARSNTPLQALTLLNDPVFVECAQHLAKRMMQEAPETTAERVRWAFRLCLAREPSKMELARLVRLLEEQAAFFAEHAPEEAERLASVQPETIDETALAAAHVVLARAIMNLDEFVTRE